MKAKAKRVNGRWQRGGARYDAKTQDHIDEKYHEAHGWRNGARVRRR